MTSITLPSNDIKGTSRRDKRAVVRRRLMTVFKLRVVVVVVVVVVVAKTTNYASVVNIFQNCVNIVRFIESVF